MIAAAKKICLKDNAKESWLKNEEAELKKREEESEGLRSIGSEKDQQITEQNQ